MRQRDRRYPSFGALLDGAPSRPWQDERDADVAARATPPPTLAALTAGQATYLRALDAATVTLCTGPAGSGKTYLACGHAARRLRAGTVDRIVLTRPLVSCGAGYGHRPGTVREKVTPVFRPMLEALGEFLGAAGVEAALRDGTVELYPLDDMRGASLKRTYLLCDEAQNALYGQLHMVLTRFGEGSQVVLCGDATATQTDLRHDGPNPFAAVRERLGAVAHPAIALVALTWDDVVRHPLLTFIDRTLSA